MNNEKISQVWEETQKKIIEQLISCSTKEQVEKVFSDLQIIDPINKRQLLLQTMQMDTCTIPIDLTDTERYEQELMIFLMGNYKKKLKDYKNVIKTKFKIGDEVYYLRDNKVFCHNVIKIEIMVDSTITIIRYSLNYNDGIGLKLDECNCFKTKQELLNSL